MSKTQENLMAAFAGESQANRKYLAFAKQADKEGLTQAAKLFRAAADAETIHAHAHLKYAGKIGTTAENLQAAIDGEVYESKTMYPDMKKDAEAEGNKAVAHYFSFAEAAEGVHADLYSEMLQNLDKNEDAEYYICPVCGYLHKGKFEGKCPVCGVDATKFYTVG